MCIVWSYKANQESMYVVLMDPAPQTDAPPTSRSCIFLLMVSSSTPGGGALVRADDSVPIHCKSSASASWNWPGEDKGGPVL